MKKLSILVLVCLLLPTVLTACLSGEQTTTPHTCAFGEAWAFDATQHYHACTCGEKSDAANHADENNDGACDVCAIIMSNEHVFDNAWTSDATDHWHAALCGHDMVDAKAAHTPNAIGNCAVCGYKVSTPSIATINEALALATQTQTSVMNGLLKFGSEYFEAYSWYEYVGNSLHVYDTRTDTHTYATQNEDGTVYYLTISSNNVGSPYAVVPNADVTYMGGPVVDLSNLGLEETHYGPVALVQRLYNLATVVDDDASGDVAPAADGEDGEEPVNPVQNFAESYENGVGSFSFTYSVDQDYYSETQNYTVEFVVAPETYILENVNVTVASDNGYGVTNYFFNFEQSINAIDAHKPEAIIPTSYKMVDATGAEINFETGIAFEAGQYTIKFTDVAPADAILAAAGVQVKFLNAEGEEMGEYDMFANLSGTDLTITCYKPGTYTAVLTIADKTYSIPVVVSYKVPELIEVGVNGDWGVEPVTETTIFTNVVLDMESIVGIGENPNVNAVILEDTTNASIVRSDSENANNQFSFTATAAGTYTVKVTSVVNENATATVVITVIDPPTVADMAQGEYNSADPYGPAINLVFNPTSETEGTLTVTSTDYWGGSTTDTFTYTIVDDVFTATWVEGGDGYATEVTITDYKLYVLADGWDIEMAAVAPLEAVTVVGGTVDTPEALDPVTGKYSVTIAAGEIAYFIISSDMPCDITSITSDTATIWTSNPRKGESEFQWASLDPSWGQPSATFWIKNETAEAITVEFTVNITAH